MATAQGLATACDQSLETEGVDAATEETLYAASRVARGELLKAGVFPLSRPENPDQLAGLDPDLASAMTGPAAGGPCRGGRFKDPGNLGGPGAGFDRGGRGRRVAPRLTPGKRYAPTGARCSARPKCANEQPL